LTNATEWHAIGRIPVQDGDIVSPVNFWYGGCLNSGMQEATEQTDSKNGNVENSTDAATSSPITSGSAKLAALQRHLKENESQRTEINGYINQLSIQLHRWQLRLQTLNERNKQLTDEMVGLDHTDRPQS
jgi:chromosome segregation ATPase